MRRRTHSETHEAIESLHDYGIIIDSREIFISGEVDGEGELGSRFIKNIRFLANINDSEPIVIHHHSLGGDWATGVIIHDAIMLCPCPIILVCHGVIASMGTIITTACFKHKAAVVVSMPNCEWMYHEGTTEINEMLTQKQRRSWAAWEDRLMKTMMTWYFQCCRGSDKFKGKTDSYIEKYLKEKMEKKEDWWLTSEEALDHGFIDGIFGQPGYESIQAIKTGKFVDDE